MEMPKGYGITAHDFAAMKARHAKAAMKPLRETAIRKAYVIVEGSPETLDVVIPHLFAACRRNGKLVQITRIDWMEYVVTLTDGARVPCAEFIRLWDETAQPVAA
jgi:hypothetical protein